MSSQAQSKANYLSPPVSPDKTIVKNGLKRSYSKSIGENDPKVNSEDGQNNALNTVDTKENKPQQWMTIRSYQKKIKVSEITRFVDAYNIYPKSNRTTQSKKKRAYASNTSYSCVPKEKSASGEHNLTSSSQNSDAETSARTYGTRSKKKAVVDESTNEVNLDSRAASRSNSRINSDDDNSDKRIFQKNVLETTNGDKLEFLKLSNVQLIHDVEIDEIPNFEPQIDLDETKLNRICKKIGLNFDNKFKASNVNNKYKLTSKEVALIHSLKLTPMQFVDTKKRFFAEKARKRHSEMTFKKTDAQKACKIDVNKASKLHEIDRFCGFLNDELFEY
ncbi:SWIRM domain-containing protein [Wickerhamomyces ciferrii]|uniref:SWIRM domain-containing protein n=1 Tax=Wickerhamomyces ciferrii (strain ATCC 14091 / BCRC 22168 / CBS 111 / JCM 3599 / NBRC 0793 / NRRL Y-1031 F-60-10) TaxID=1206466 RepID=K0KN93_WICCF|nr:SWIRM domain-containing protein [Wickerhamomyces ciferrii]CCH44461.1 SWIRM domain-containing protein [Wickerhamomyces ciferrii]